MPQKVSNKKYPKIRDLRLFLLGLESEERDQLETDVDTTIEYLLMCAGGHRRMSVDKARIVSSHSGIAVDVLRHDSA